MRTDKHLRFVRNVPNLITCVAANQQSDVLAQLIAYESMTTP